MSFLTIENTAVILFFIGFYGLISSKKIIKSIIATGILELGVVIFYLGSGFTEGNSPPIGTVFENVADPLPQAIVITAIIIGVAVTSINLIMFISLCRQHGAYDWESAKNIETE